MPAKRAVLCYFVSVYFFVQLRYLCSAFLLFIRPHEQAIVPQVSGANGEPSSTGHLTQQQYLDTLPWGATVEVPRQRRHGLTGKPSNRRLVEERQEFRKFVEAHRAPVGRTEVGPTKRHGPE